MTLSIDDVASLGCIVCYNLGFRGSGASPAAVHHLRCDVGMGQRSSRFIPLCPLHHQYGPDAFHAGRRHFEACFGTEEALWLQVVDLLGRSA